MLVLNMMLPSREVGSGLNQLKKIRNKRKMTQKEMAEKIGVSISYYSKIEGGFKEPSYQFLKKLYANFEGLDMNLFFK